MGDAAFTTPPVDMFADRDLTTVASCDRLATEGCLKAPVRRQAPPNPRPSRFRGGVYGTAVRRTCRHTGGVPARKVRKPSGLAAGD